MTVKAYNRMIRKMRKYVSSRKSFNRFRNDHLGYNIGWGMMYKAWKVAEMQVFGRIKSQDLILTYK